VELTHTPSYLPNARSANPVRGNLYERCIWPKP
jgi:hypothetical protein